MNEEERKGAVCRVGRGLLGTLTITVTICSFADLSPDLRDKIIFWLVIFCFWLLYLIYQDADALKDANAHIRELEEKNHRLTENRNALEEQYKEKSKLLDVAKDRNIALISIATIIANTDDKSSRQNFWKLFMEVWDK